MNLFESSSPEKLTISADIPGYCISIVSSPRSVQGGENDAVAGAHGRPEAEEAGEAEVGGDRREQREERRDEHGGADDALEAEMEGQPTA